MSKLTIDPDRLIARLKQLGEIERESRGIFTRLAGSDADREGRDALVRWMTVAGLDVRVDQVGNIFGIWQVGDLTRAQVLMGSHIDTVINAGIYDGCYGVRRRSR